MLPCVGSSNSDPRETFKQFSHYNNRYDSDTPDYVLRSVSTVRTPIDSFANHFIFVISGSLIFGIIQIL